MAPSVIDTSSGSAIYTPPSSTNDTFDVFGTNVYRGYDHATWYVGNAKQAASWYSARMGFRIVAHSGLETGSRNFASYMVTNGRARFVFTSPIRGPSSYEDGISAEERHLLEDIHAHLEKHGDAVKDIAFEVDNVRAVYANAIAKGAQSVREPTSLKDEHGQVSLATIKTYGDTTHTFVERRNYNGVFLPGYRLIQEEDPISQYLPEVKLDVIDHCVGNQNWDEMESVCKL